MAAVTFRLLFTWMPRIITLLLLCLLLTHKAPAWSPFAYMLLFVAISSCKWVYGWRKGHMLLVKNDMLKSGMAIVAILVASLLFR